MKTRNIIQQQIRRRRRHGLVATLVASLASVASVAPAIGADPATQRKLPGRLPSVTSSAESGVDNVAGPERPRWTTDGVDLVKYTSGNEPSDTSTQPIEEAIPAVTNPNRTRLVSDSFQVPPASPLAQAPSNSQAGSSSVPTRWLRSTTSTAASEVARRLLVQASGEYDAGAWLSAETTAWDALRWSAESVDLGDRENAQTVKADSALSKLQFAKRAIREARDFSGIYGELDSAAIARMARSHDTDVLDNQTIEGLTATDASDRYLDEARVALATIASRSVEAAQTMDLLSAIYLSRADAKTLPSATALCLRRAALQGQPHNASLASRLGMHLADVGLYQEARWALEHSMSIEADPQTADVLAKVLRRSGHGEDAAHLIASMQDRAHGNRLAQAAPNSRVAAEPNTPKIPEITQLSPADFAALSRPVMPVSRSTIPVSASVVSAKTNVQSVPETQVAIDSRSRDAADMAELEQDEKPSIARRFMNSFKRVW